jgi:hypothetical protein
LGEGGRGKVVHQQTPSKHNTYSALKRGDVVTVTRGLNFEDTVLGGKKPDTKR